MRRFNRLISILAVVLAGFSMLSAAPAALADEGSQAATRCPSPLATPTGEPVASPPATPAAETVCVGVAIGDYYVHPDRTTFRAGERYIFAVGNEGLQIHEFVIERAGAVDEPLEVEVGGEDREAEIEDIAPGQSAELEWTFTEPGKYQFSCHVPGHFEEGMVIEIEVVE